MTTRRLLPLFLILLQSGLTAVPAHAHADLAAHTEVPHFHAHDLLALFAPVHDRGNTTGTTTTPTRWTSRT